MKHLRLAIVIVLAATTVNAEEICLAIIPFMNSSDNPANDYVTAGFASAVSSKLTKINLEGIRVIERLRLNDIMKELALSQTGAISSDKVIQVGQLTGANYLLMGEIGVQGKKIQITSRLVETATGQAVSGKSLSLKGKLGDLFELQDQFVMELTKKLNIELTAEKKLQLKEKETASIEAYKWFTKGLALNNMSDEELGFYQRALELDNNFAGAANGIGIVYYTRHQYKLAQEFFERANAMDPKRVDVKINLGYSANQNRNYDVALEAFKNALMLNPASVDAYRGIGSLYLKQYKYQEALSYFQMALSFQSKWGEIYNDIGNVHMQMSDMKSAEENYRKAVELAPNQSAPYVNLATICIRKNSLDQALDYLTRAVAINPRDPACLANKAEVELDLKKNQQAVESAQRSVTLDPQYSRAYYQLGDGCHRMGLINRAIESYEKGLSNDSLNYVARNNLGTMYFDQSRYQDAYQMVRRSIGIDSSYSDAYYNLGIICERLGAWYEAGESYRRFLMLSAGKPEYASRATEVEGRLRILPKR